MPFMWAMLFLVCLCLSFLFAGFETGFISWNTLKMEHRASRGKWVARRAVFLQERVEQVISTVLIGNNIALVLLSTSIFSFLAYFSENVPEFWVNLVLTPVILVLCELFPKSLFRIYSFRLSYIFVPFIYVFFVLFYPVTVLFRFVSGGGNAHVSEEEIVSIATEGEKDKSLTPFSKQVVTSALTLEKTSLSVLFKHLTPSAVYPVFAPNGEKHRSLPTEIEEQGAVFPADNMAAVLLGNPGLISLEYIIIEDKDRFLCYTKEQCFEKIFLEKKK
ncbi:CNNM domain-containing protein [Chitinivibrio alkaliphilus]|uniref:CNNM transmembrane domain-containing protein n=1 Tax=Chitinivibrio alkaliphilus ACht1 TaxID=1313304 RepID=U7DB25_9BACT|nr:DUF21 domain-containing protein [Chitinivibrio alkaliphilus]ERP31610.1 hypothetical protein CALK_1474 [Chitinivibrio alkaliphilus ACht1]